MESRTATPGIEPAVAAPPSIPVLPRIGAARRALIANAALGGMVISALLMAAGAAGTPSPKGRPGGLACECF